VYSIGSVLFNILTSKHLYPGVSNDEIVAENRQGNVDHVPYYLENTSPPCSYELIDFLMKLLNPNPFMRPTAKMALGHPWFTSVEEGGNYPPLAPCIKACLLWNETMY
jgi:serine/threonine protein kinase